MMNRIDGRGWAAIGAGFIFLVVFLARAAVPVLRTDPVTASIVTDIERGGLLLAFAFYFAASKSDKPTP